MIVVGPTDQMSRTLHQFLKDFFANAHKIFLLFALISILTSGFWKHSITYHLKVDDRLCIYEFGCQQVGFLYFRNVLKAAISDFETLNFITWDKIVNSYPWYESAIDNSIQIEAINKKVKSRLISHSKQLLEMFETHPDNENTDEMLFEKEIFDLRARILVLETTEKIIEIDSKNETNPFDYYKARAFFIFLLATVCQIILAPIVFRTREFISK